MIDKRLLHEIPKAKRYIGGQVLLQWISLLANILIIWSVSTQIQLTYRKALTHDALFYHFGMIIILILVKMACARKAQEYAHHASSQVKIQMRDKLYQKLLSLKDRYQNHVSTSELVQLSVEGIDQLEIYFGRYLAQFFYSLLAPITLFIVLLFINWQSALVLLIFVPLIPASIIAIQKFAKRLLSKYWGAYTNMGDSFLENLQGLTTLKIYQADKHKHQQMNEEAEYFRRITMKVLTMQLNSVSIMDVVAYGGAALGCITAVYQYRVHDLSLAGVILIILLSAEFFLPMRLLGSYFHIAMNGMAASDKIFKIFDIEESNEELIDCPQSLYPIKLENVGFRYFSEQAVLKNMNMEIKQGSFIGVCGLSGSGKSTLAKLLFGIQKGYEGSLSIHGLERASLNDDTFRKHGCYVSHQGLIAKGSVRSNLLMGNPEATDEMMWKALEAVKLDAFMHDLQGLDTRLEEAGTNFSGGQRQRLVLARALLKDCDFYIFDEATSNIDETSEQAILDVIQQLKGKKTILMITHRLRSMMSCDQIYLLSQGAMKEQGTHRELMNSASEYYTLFMQQQELEMMREA